MDETELKEKYPHFVVGSLRYDLESNKQIGTLICKKCKKKHESFTSCFYQSELCKECRKQAKNNRRREARMLLSLLRQNPGLIAKITATPKDKLKGVIDKYCQPKGERR
jgi:hypothetical protein